MPAHAVVSHQQMEILVGFMEENRDLATGRLSNSGPLAKQIMKAKWEELAAKLNSVGVGATKSAAKWRDYWNEKKYVVRRKAQGLNMHARGTGGGPAKGVSLTPFEDRILNLMGKVAVFGESSVRIPFDDPMDVSPVPPLLAADDELPSLLAPQPLRLPSPPPFSTPPISTGSPCASTSAAASPSAGAEASRSADAAAGTSAASTSVATGYSRREPSAPRWALQIEERRVAAEEKAAEAVASIAAILAAIQATLARIEEKM